MHRSRVLFVTSNGQGVGHLTRCMAIAKRLPSGMTPVIFTLSEGVGFALAEGFVTEYFPSRVGDPFGDGRVVWERRLAERLTSVIAMYDPAVVVFDGTLPYAGLVQNVWRFPQRAFVWCRRAMWKPGKADASLVNAAAFRLIIEPGEWAAHSDRGPTTRRRHEAVRVPPVLLYDEDAMLDRRDAQRQLGLDANKTNVLVSLGAGTLNDMASLTRACVVALQGEPSVSVAVARSAVSESGLTSTGEVAVLDRYPLAPYLRAFDMAITGSGYHSFHEIIQARIPSLQVPNVDTMVDDQGARARAAARGGLALAWMPGDGLSLEEAVQALLDESTRTAMRRRLADVRLSNGAALAADRIVELVEAR